MNALLKTALDGARMIGEQFQAPDDDWTPALMYLTGEAIKICGLVLADDDHAEVADAIAAKLRSDKATAAVIITSAWTITRGADSPVERPSQASDRQEELVITYADRDSITMVGFAINRDGINPPTLSDEPDLLSHGIEVDGLFATALRRGVAEVEVP